MKRISLGLTILVGLSSGSLAGQVRTDSKPDNRYDQNIVPFPDTPKNHWAYEGRRWIVKSGLYAGFDEETGTRGRPLGRFDFARRYAFAAYRAFEHAGQLQELITKISIESPSFDDAKEDRENLSSELEAVRYWLQDWHYLDRGIREFGPELKQLDTRSQQSMTFLIEAKSMLSRARMVETGGALVQFKDVPANHWSAKDVLEMRRLGLLQGYEDGHGAYTFN